MINKENNIANGSAKSEKGTEKKASRQKTKWETVKEKLPLVSMWRIKGASEEEVAERLGISKRTFLKFLRKYPEFEEAVSFDRNKTEKLVEQALLKLALGYTVRVKKVHKLKKSHYDEREKKVEEERLETAEEEQNIPPNLSAQTFWLKSRFPEHWSEKITDDEENKSLFGIVEIPFSELAEDKGEDRNE